MVVFAAALVALTPPAAHVAVVNWLRVMSGFKVSRIRGNRAMESLANEPIKRTEVGEPERLNRINWIRGNDVELLGQRLLDAGKEIGVERELEDCRPTCLPRELRVVNLVRPRTEGAGRLDSAKDIRDSQPPVGPKHALSDGSVALVHGLEAALHGFGTRETAEIEDLVATLLDRLDVLLLMLFATLLQKLQERVRGPRGFRPEPERNLHVQRGAMPAGQKAAEVGGGELEAAAY
jgi:hypothetical protein